MVAEILGAIEPYVEAINLLLAIAVVTLSLVSYAKLSGRLKIAWFYFMTAIVFFGVHEVIGVLEEFGIWEMEGLYAFSEMIFIALFLISACIFYKLFKELSKSKK